MEKTGRKEKDAEITENFNMKKRGVISIMTEEANKATAKREKAEEKYYGKKDEGISNPIDGTEKEDMKSAYQMLRDLRFAVKNATGKDGKKGRERLVELLASDSDFKFAVKELIKIEASLMAAKIRAKEEMGGSGNVTTFVVLKGLHADKEVLGMTDKDVDLKQVVDAINPTLEKQIAYEPEVEGPKV